MLCGILAEQENLRVSDAAAGTFSLSRRESPYLSSFANVGWLRGQWLRTPFF